MAEPTEAGEWETRFIERNTTHVGKFRGGEIEVFITTPTSTFNSWLMEFRGLPDIQGAVPVPPGADPRVPLSEMKERAARHVDKILQQEKE